MSQVGDTFKWDDRGLLPAVAQEVGTGRVLMVAWMNREALDKTVETGLAHYWSRSRQSLWKKGATSGNLQHVESIRVDCDKDTVLLRVRAEGGIACHTGRPSCFYLDIDGQELATPPDTEAVLGLLMRVIESRKGADPSESWTAKLLDRGVTKISAKITEESGELVQALSSEGDVQVVKESADVLYHVMVGLASRGLRMEDVTDELVRRFGVSGLMEKASRGR